MTDQVGWELRAFLRRHKQVIARELEADQEPSLRLRFSHAKQPLDVVAVKQEGKTILSITTEPVHDFRLELNRNSFLRLTGPPTKTAEEPDTPLGAPTELFPPIDQAATDLIAREVGESTLV